MVPQAIPHVALSCHCCAVLMLPRADLLGSSASEVLGGNRSPRGPGEGPQGKGQRKEGLQLQRGRSAIE